MGAWWPRSQSLLVGLAPAQGQECAPAPSCSLWAQAAPCQAAAGAGCPRRHCARALGCCLGMHSWRCGAGDLLPRAVLLRPRGWQGGLGSTQGSSGVSAVPGSSWGRGKGDFRGVGVVGSTGQGWGAVPVAKQSRAALCPLLGCVVAVGASSSTGAWQGCAPWGWVLLATPEAPCGHRGVPALCCGLLLGTRCPHACSWLGAGPAAAPAAPRTPPALPWAGISAHGGSLAAVSNPQDSPRCQCPRRPLACPQPTFGSLPGHGSPAPLPWASEAVWGPREPGSGLLVRQLLCLK